MDDILGRSISMTRLKPRLSDISGILPYETTDLLDFAKESVDYRNYIVHGWRWDKPKPSGENLRLFVDTIEFIFLASELKYCGWDYGFQSRVALHHPFDKYISAFKRMCPQGPMRKLSPKPFLRVPPMMYGSNHYLSIS